MGEDKNLGKILTELRKFSGEKMYRRVLSARRVCQGVVSVKVRGPELQFSDRAQTSSNLGAGGMYQPAATFTGRSCASPELSGYS